MKFKANTRRRALEYEKDIIRYWKENKTFEKSIEQRPIENSYVFYDGPPFITGVPHHGTLLSNDEGQACRARLGMGYTRTAS
jgi:isoleucyl-tRNA synthetase